MLIILFTYLLLAKFIDNLKILGFLRANLVKICIFAFPGQNVPVNGLKMVKISGF